MRYKTTKLKMYKDVLSLFVDKLPKDEIIEGYLKEDDSSYLELTDFIGMHMKDEIHWSTILGIIEACDKIINEAIWNVNVIIEE